MPAVSFGPLTKPAPACTLALVALSGRVPAPERHLCMHAPADGRTSKRASEPAKSSIQRRHRGNDSVWRCEDAVGQRGRRMRQWRATDAAGGGRHDVVLHGCCDSVAYTRILVHPCAVILCSRLADAYAKLPGTVNYCTLRVHRDRCSNANFTRPSTSCTPAFTLALAQRQKQSLHARSWPLACNPNSMTRRCNRRSNEK